jgi:DNA mismatch repair protein MutL
MSRTIHILPPLLANKLAAGEVVQRPASAVKELLENSIDAGARSITVIIKDAGKALLHVIDDGEGMSPDDALLAFERHATSKIGTYEDLENIRTLGFRGEALASIAAVGQVELRTRQGSAEIGTRVRVDGGIVIESAGDATQPGTSIAVRNLFYNTPARRHFLKSNNTEFRHIVDVVQRMAIAHPNMSIKLVSDEETIFNLHSAPLPERIQDLFGEKLFQTVFAFEEANELARINGFLGKPNFARKSNIEQYLFLNKRYVVNRAINHAVLKAYENLLEKGTFPFFVLFLEVDPHHVDVNVHPSKMEVKFEDEGSIYRFVLSSVRKALAAHDLIPSVSMSVGDSHEVMAGLRFQQRPSGQRSGGWRELLVGVSSTAQPEQTDSVQVDRQPLDGSMNLATVRPDVAQGERTSMHVWQLHNKYIVLPTENGLMIVDQHAAHERVLYERAVSRFDATNSASQQLLFPHTIEMTSGDAALVQELLPHLERLGFRLKLFGATTVIVDAVPIDVKPGKEATILQEMIDLFKEDEHGVKLEPREKLAKSYSCRAAVKAGDPLNTSEMHSLLDQLFQTEIPYVCPHGRPVIIKMSLDELDRRFGRTS